MITSDSMVTMIKLSENQEFNLKNVSHSIEDVYNSNILDATFEDALISVFDNCRVFKGTLPFSLSEEEINHFLAHPQDDLKAIWDPQSLLEKALFQYLVAVKNASCTVNFAQLSTALTKLDERIRFVLYISDLGYDESTPQFHGRPAGF